MVKARNARPIFFEEERRMAKMAILVDGGFYRVRIRSVNGRTAQSPQDMATELVEYCSRHAAASKCESGRELYRTFYYDCPPVQASVRNPITRQTEDIGRSPTISRSTLTESVRSKGVASVYSGLTQRDTRAEWWRWVGDVRRAGT